MANILVVDDAFYTHQLLKLILQKDNHTITSVHSSQEAIKHLASQAVDIMITDVNMPVMDGFDLLDWLRADERYKQLPVIIMTASGQTKMPEIAAEKGASGFLTHPFGSWELNKLIEECLQPAL